MVIVIGGGLAGLSAALHLGERGVPVTPVQLKAGDISNAKVGWLVAGPQTMPWSIHARSRPTSSDVNGVPRSSGGI